MNEFAVVFFIDNEVDQSRGLISLNEKELAEWKKELEARALSEYYGKKIKVSER